MGRFRVIKIYFAGSRRIRLLLVSLIILVILDGIITRYWLAQGLITEGNPVLQSLVNDDKFLLIKPLGALFAALLLWDIYRHNAKLALVTAYCVVSSYAVVVLWNILAPIVISLSYHVA